MKSERGSRLQHVDTIVRVADCVHVLYEEWKLNRAKIELYEALMSKIQNLFKISLQQYTLLINGYDKNIKS